MYEYVRLYMKVDVKASLLEVAVELHDGSAIDCYRVVKRDICGDYGSIHLYRRQK